jgi:hypothetical protein
MSPPSVDSKEVQVVKDALNLDITDAGVGILHVPANRIHLRPSSQTRPVGHDALVRQLGLSRSDCKGFVIVKDVSGMLVIENLSQLNIGSGGPKSLMMPPSLFGLIKQAVIAAGL